jgi:hypothetical protein
MLQKRHEQHSLLIGVAEEQQSSWLEPLPEQ